MKKNLLNTHMKYFLDLFETKRSKQHNSFFNFSYFDCVNFDVEGLNEARKLSVLSDLNMFNKQLATKDAIQG